jgi:threonine dehydrogenase-like Zn-dependent dehydrogenase
VKKGGIVSIVGVYGPIQLCAHRQCGEQGHHHSRQPSLGEAIAAALDRARAEWSTRSQALITHRIPLEYVSDGYRIFSAKLDNCIKPVLLPPSARS